MLGYFYWVLLLFNCYTFLGNYIPDIPSLGRGYGSQHHISDIPSLGGAWGSLQLLYHLWKGFFGNFIISWPSAQGFRPLFMRKGGMMLARGDTAVAIR